MFHRGSMVVLLGLLLTPPALGSGPTGSITGTVTDPSAAVVRNAHITVLNEATNAVRNADTNDDGDFTVALLPPGRYRVTAEGAGFRRSIFNDVNVDVDRPSRLFLPARPPLPLQPLATRRGPT